MKIGETKRLFISCLPRFGEQVFLYCHASDHTQKLGALECILDKIYDQITSNRRHYQMDGEDKITINIVEKLQSLGIEATHDTDVGGHCDIIVESRNGEFKWLAEAKIHSGYDWLLAGFLQLVTRYGVATPGKDSGEIIIYCRNDRARPVLDKWIKFLLESRAEVSVHPIQCSNPLRFRTVHQCETSGLDFTIRHSIIPLKYEPAN